MQDILVHAYFSTDERVLWDVIQNELEPLNKAVEAILGNLDAAE